MSDTDNISVARVYADAILQLASAQGDAHTLDRELSEFCAYLKIDPDFRAFITSRTVDDDARRASLDNMFSGRMSDLLLNSLQVLNDKNRLDIITYVQQEYHRLFLEQEGIREIHVVSAEPLSDAQRARLVEVMSARTGRSVALIESVDPQLLGGVVVRVGDQQIDVSIRWQLQRFRTALQEHAERHIHAGAKMFEGAASL